MTSRVSNIIAIITSDPKIIQFVTVIHEEPKYRIPDFRELFESLQTISASDKAVMISKIRGPEDYQKQMNLLAIVQHNMDRIHETNTTIYHLKHIWMELHRRASAYINKKYFNELDVLRSDVRKSTVTSILLPIEEGIAHLQSQEEIGEKIYKHLDVTNWNIRLSSNLIKDYLSLLRGQVPVSVDV